MTFTDDDLKRLKEDLEIPERTMFVDEHEMRAILARLEAAEKVCHAVLGIEDLIKITLVLGDNSRERAMERLNATYKAWRKAAGRE